MSVANHSVAIGLAAIFITPFLFILLTALMSPEQALSRHVWPSPFVWGNFAKVLNFVPFTRYAWNTIVYSVLATVGTVASSIPVAYALSRMY